MKTFVEINRKSLDKRFTMTYNLFNYFYEEKCCYD